MVMTKDGTVVDSGAGPSCADYEWSLRPACEIGGNATCRMALRCGAADDGAVRYYYDIYLRRTGTGWIMRGSVCIGDDSDVVTTADIGEEVRRDWQVWVPKQRPSLQPVNGKTLVDLPTYFDSGQPQRMPAEAVRVFDTEVILTAEGEWEWTFEPGVKRKFDVPGSKYDDPDPQVTYTYETAGPRVVELTTTWWGRFRVGGYGPYDIENPATQGPQRLDLEVVDSGPVLSR